MPEVQKSLRAIFDEASEMAPGEERQAWLDKACGGDAALRGNVEELLRSEEAAGGFLAAPKRDAPTASAPVTEREGDRIGRYKLLQKIGEGGCGVVYMAEQTEPVRRRVALKVIKLGMDTRSVIARFEAERQALAMMDHPNIARVLDAGATETGRPYFVMELVRGIKITDYCEQNQLSTPARLQLFVRVCQAVQHAHQKGIIHRDLKPSNILVTSDDGEPLPKVIDFGIAKATADIQLTDKTLFTRFEMFIGTPAYMSPEQAEFNASDIDTRTDIYALGVLLYELLTGHQPFDPETWLKSGIEAMRKAIRETEPLRPSTRLTMELAAPVGKSPGRRLPTRELIDQLRGDLDWIILKALEKDRTRRYDTANGLAMDIERHLANEPIIARPPSLVYRTQKAWQRNKLVFSSAVLVGLALVIGTGVSAWQAVQATRAKRLAQIAQSLAQSKQHESERSEARARRAAYGAEMIAAQASWEHSNMGTLRNLLAATRSSPERGFEWDHWQHMAHQDVLTLRGHGSSVSSIAISPDGRRIVTGSRDGTARVWEVTTGRELVKFTGQGGPIGAVAFSPDGRLAASVTQPDPMRRVRNNCRIWDASTGLLLHTVDLPDWGGGVAFSPDGRRVVCADWGNGKGEIVFLNPDTGGVVRRLRPGFSYGGNNVVFSADGRWLMAGNRGVKILDAGTFQVVQTFEDKDPEAEVHAPVAFFPDGLRIASVSSNQVATVRNWKTGQGVVTFQGHTDGTTAIACSPDGRKVVTGSQDRTVRVWDAATGAESSVFRGHSATVKAVAFFPDNQRVASSSDDGTVKIWDAQHEPEFIRLSGHTAVVYAVAFSPDGKWIASASRDKTVRVWEAATGRLIQTCRGHPDQVATIAFFPDSQRLVSGGGGLAIVWEAATGRQLLSLEMGARRAVKSVAVSPDGTRIATAGTLSAVSLWDATTGRDLPAESREWPEFGTGQHEVAFSPDGQRLYLGGGFLVKPIFKVWDRVARAEVAAPEGSLGATSVAFSPDRRRMIGWFDDGRLKMWDADTGRLLPVAFSGHVGGITQATFSPDGRRIATSSWEGSISLWDVETGWELLNFKPGKTAMGIAFSPDGRQLVGAVENELAMWNRVSAEELSRWEREENDAAARTEASRAEWQKRLSEEYPRAWEARDRDREAMLERDGPAPQHAPAKQSRPLQVGDPGVIRQWLVLAPIPLMQPTVSALFQELLPNEAQLRPREGERAAAPWSEFAWTAVQTGPESYQLDFEKLARAAHPEYDIEDHAALAVAYLVSERPQTGITLLAGSDDVARIFLNGREVYRQLEFRGWVADQDEVRGVELKAGLNVLVFKVLNGIREWAGSVRLLDAHDQPLKGIRVTLDRDGK